MTHAQEPAHSSPDRAVMWVAGALVLWSVIAYLLAGLLDRRSYWDALLSGPSSEVLLAMGAKVDAWVASGQVERLLVSTWLHATPTHLVVNVLWLLVLGGVFRRLRLDAGLFFVVCFFGGLGGQTLSFALSMGPSIGASGSIYAAIGLVSVVIFDRARRRDIKVATIAVGVAVLVLPWLMRVGSDHAAHFGGMLIGFLFSQVRTWPHMQRICVTSALVLTIAALVAMGFQVTPVLT